MESSKPFAAALPATFGDRLLPAGLRAHPGLRFRSQGLLIASGLVTGAGWVYSLSMWASGLYALAAVLGIGLSVSGLGATLLLHVGGRTGPATHGLALGALATGTVSAFLASAPMLATSWFGVIPLSVLAIEGPRVSFVWFLVAELSIVVMLGCGLADASHGAGFQVVQAFTWLGVPGATYLTGWLFALHAAQARSALRRARVTAEAAVEARSQFVANMSHEIRTPLHGVVGTASLLGTTSLDDEQRHLVRLIESSGESLVAIINDILDFSKIEAGKMALRRVPTDLDSLVKESVELFREAARSKSIELTLEVDPELPPRLFADPVRVRQVVSNLVSNAIKFTDDGGVSIRVGPEISSDLSHWVAVRVRDSGIGIAPERHLDLFEPFVQLDTSATRRFGGTGLGLSISSRLAQAMGGRIDVSSSPGFGSTFTFRFPLEPAETPSTSLVATTVDCDGERSAHVLVVEDNAVNREIVCRMLSRLGCRYDTAEHGLQALERLEDRDYDLILMDCQMPQMDGLACTRAIRTREAREGGRRRIVALTANALAEDRTRCLEAGMDACLAKPVRLQELEALLVVRGGAGDGGSSTPAECGG